MSTAQRITNLLNIDIRIVILIILFVMPIESYNNIWSNIRHYVLHLWFYFEFSYYAI